MEFVSRSIYSCDVVHVKYYVFCSNALRHQLPIFSEKAKIVNVVKAILPYKIIFIFEIKTLLCVKTHLKLTPGLV